MTLSDDEKNHRTVLERLSYLTTLVVRVRTDQKILRERFSAKDYKTEKATSEVARLKKKVKELEGTIKLLKLKKKTFE